jgi:hypothetical protein
MWKASLRLRSFQPGDIVPRHENVLIQMWVTECSHIFILAYKGWIEPIILHLLEKKIILGPIKELQ